MPIDPDVPSLEELAALNGLLQQRVRLEDAGYLAIDKTYRDRRPVTWYQLTATGQQHLDQHIQNLTRLIDRAR